MFINDFYAGVIALAGIILFAKFVTHGPRSDNAESPGCLLRFLHIVCVAASLLVLSLSLAILGEVFVPKSWPVFAGWPKNAEGDIRTLVFWAVMVATVILAVDVAQVSKAEKSHHGTRSRLGDGRDR